MYSKESLTIKGSAIYQLANCTCILLRYLIELFHTSNIILCLLDLGIIQIDCNVWLECMVVINFSSRTMLLSWQSVDTSVEGEAPPPCVQSLLDFLTQWHGKKTVFICKLQMIHVANRTSTETFQGPSRSVKSDGRGARGRSFCMEITL